MTSQQYKELSVREFTKAAESYESNHAGVYNMCKKDYPDVLAELEKEPFEDLLDCGCGPAPMLTLLHEKYPERHYTGIDLTPKMIEVAKAKHLPNVELVVGDCENLPFADESFDVVICCESFHHYPNPQDFFNSVYRVLRPNGRLILRDMTMKSAAVRWFCNTIEMPLAHLGGKGDVRIYGREDLQKLCQKAGLHMESFEKRGFCRLHCVFRKPEICEDPKIQISLGDVQETALIPLAIKASESKRPNNRIYDAKAVEIIERLRIDTEPYDKFMSHEGVVARTILFDQEVKKALRKYPETIVVNIGCGLDDRFSRVDNGKVRWYQVDLPDSIALRRKCFTEREREFLIEGDLLSDTWTNDIPTDAVPIIIAEGLLMYFTEDQVRHLLAHLQRYFKKGYLLAELMHPMAANNSKHHDTVKATNAQFHWGIADGRELEELCSGYKMLRETNFFEEMRKYTTAGKIGDLLFRKFNDRLAVYRFYQAT
jgi:O-methyltransferase involved in polyketide biosynthesis/ubiquinone/menaquinone biosynthesis C-methylase UbiE